MATSRFSYYLFVGNKTPASNEAVKTPQKQKRPHHKTEGRSRSYSK